MKHPSEVNRFILYSLLLRLFSLSQRLKQMYFLNDVRRLLDKLIKAVLLRRQSLNKYEAAFIALSGLAAFVLIVTHDKGSTKPIVEGVEIGLSILVMV